MKILYTYNFYKEHGGENQWFSSEPELMSKNGHDVKVFSKDNKEIDNYSIINKINLFNTVTWNDNSYKEILKIINDFQPDIVHAYNIIAILSPSIFFACREKNVPIIQTLYNYRLLCPAATFLRNDKICTECIDFGLKRSVVHKCYRNSFLQSFALARMLDKHYKMGTWKNIINQFIVPTDFMANLLIDNGFFKDQISIKANFHEPDPGINYNTKKHVLFVGRLTVEKGIKTLIKTWFERENLPKLLIIGSGPLEEFIKVELNRGTKSPAQFLGKKRHKDVIEYLKHSLAMIIPSEWYEAFPHTILEAYACGIPVIASEIGTLKDVIINNENGLLFKIGDTGDLAKQINKLSSGSQLFRKISHNARKDYLKNYTGEANYKKLIDIYNKVIKRFKQKR